MIKHLTTAERQEVNQKLIQDPESYTAWPDWAPKQYNACTDPCDMWTGPCAVRGTRMEIESVKTLILKCPSCAARKKLSETAVPKEGPGSPQWPWCETHYMPMLLEKVSVR